LKNRTDIVPQNHPSEDGQKRGSTSTFVKEIRYRLDDYFNLVIRNVRDSVPKSIGYFLVKGCQEKMQYELYAEVNKSSNLTKVLSEVRFLCFINLATSN
jgi:hypothetical protein